MKFYRLFWTDEGIGWRRDCYFILKPTAFSTYWKLRRIGGEKGKQPIEWEYDFGTEKEAFASGNLAVKTTKLKNSKYGSHPQ